MNKFVDYDQPPLEEVVFGVAFERLNEFPVAAYGKYWSEISDEFPRSTDQTPLMDDGLEFDLNNPLIRSWFVSEDNRRLIQLQQNRFIFNWRRVESNWVEYPEFSKLLPLFNSYFAHFSRFVGDLPAKQPIKVRDLELTYVNTIPFSSLKGLSDNLGELLIDHSFQKSPSRFLGYPEDFSWASKFNMRDQFGSLKVEAVSAYHSKSPSERALRLVLTCKGIPDSNGSHNNDLAEWFETAHEYIVKGFADVVDEKIQKEIWGKK